MLFENPPVPLDQLPALDPAVAQTLAPQTLRVRLIGNAIFWLTLLAAQTTTWALVFKGGQWAWYPLVLLAWAGLWSLSRWLTKKRFQRERFALRERDLTHWKGFWWRKERTVPFVRVQHVAVEQGPIQKRFGICSLHVHTASSEGDLALEGLSLEDAERVKAFITLKTDADEPA